MYGLKSEHNYNTQTRGSCDPTPLKGSTIIQSKTRSVFVHSSDGDLPAPDEGIEALGVLCINCQETVPETQIETHSRFCTTINESICRIEVDTLSSIKLRLHKFKTFLEFIRIDRDLDPANANILTILIRNLEGLLEVESATRKADVLRCIQSLIVMLKNFRGSISARIYADRTLALAQEMGKFLEEQEIITRVQEIEMLKSEIDVYRDKAKALEFSLARRGPKGQELLQRISDISSDVASNSNAGSEISDAISDSFSACDNIESEDFEVEDFKSLQDDDKDQQRNFYAICLNLKLNFSRKHAAQQIPIFELFSLAKAKNIPSDKWPDFIRKELGRASFMKPAKSRRGLRSQPRNMPSRFKYIETILEEEVQGLED
jgi:hypothetical protein